ncbi:hypothetical protein DW110_07745 [Phocaeicola plebeius]|nr:hypothetical protein DW110_07745 [Phocaeicola plebeius]
MLLKKLTCFFNFFGLEWRIGRKTKNPDSFENQDFKWCHQELYFIYKWLYIITFQKRKKGNLLLLLHLEFALFCASLRGGFLLQR